jgi:hypothetical protein
LLQAVKRGQEESDLERIQDLFPNDCLRLYDRDVITMVSVYSQVREYVSPAQNISRDFPASYLLGSWDKGDRSVKLIFHLDLVQGRERLALYLHALFTP